MAHVNLLYNQNTEFIDNGILHYNHWLTVWYWSRKWNYFTSACVHLSQSIKFVNNVLAQTNKFVINYRTVIAFTCKVIIRYELRLISFLIKQTDMNFVGFSCVDFLRLYCVSATSGFSLNDNCNGYKISETVYQQLRKRELLLPLLLF